MLGRGKVYDGARALGYVRRCSQKADLVRKQRLGAPVAGEVQSPSNYAAPLAAYLDDPADRPTAHGRLMKILALLLCVGLAHLAHAQDERGIYMGAALGTFAYDGSDSDDALIPVSDDTWAYQLTGGYKFNEHFALEAGIGGTGDIEDHFTSTVPGIGTVAFDVTGSYNIYTLTALALLPFDAITLFGGAGYYSASLDATLDAQGFGTVDSASEHNRGATAVFGLQHDFGLDLKSFSIRGQYQWYDSDNDIDLSGISIGLLYRF